MPLWTPPTLDQPGTDGRSGTIQATVRLAQATGRSAAYDHNYALGSAINESMRAFHPELSREMHRSPERSKYAVSEIYHVPHRRGEAWFRIASPDERLLRLIGGALVATGKMQVGAAQYVVEGVDAHPVDIPVAPLGVHTLSPIWIRDRDSPRSLVHDNCEYPKVLAEVINHDVKRATGRTGTVTVPNMGMLEVRKRTLAARTVMAQKGTFWLDAADARDLVHVLDWGVGHSTAMGFGMVVGESVDIC